MVFSIVSLCITAGLAAWVVVYVRNKCAEAVGKATLIKRTDEQVALTEALKVSVHNISSDMGKLMARVDALERLVDKQGVKVSVHEAKFKNTEKREERAKTPRHRLNSGFAPGRD